MLLLAGVVASWGVWNLAVSRSRRPPAAGDGPNASSAPMWLPAFDRRVGGTLPPAPTEAQAVAAARSTSLIVATRWTYQPFVAAMRRANPALRLYAYTNVAAAGADESGGYAEALFAHDAGGRRITTPYGLYLGDVANPAWIATRLADCRAALATSGYDGCYLDNLGSGLLSDGYLSAVPVHAGDQRPWTDREWLDNSIAVWKQYTTALANVPLVANGADNGTRYFDATAPSAQLVRAVRIIVAETFVRLPEAPVDASIDVVRWRRDIDMLRDAEQRGDTVLTLTALNPVAPRAAVDRWVEFTLATFLLGSDGRSRFAFVDANPESRARLRAPEPRIGKPRGPMRESGATYRREFARGLVIANPTAAPVSIELPRAYTRLDGTVVNALTLPPVSAAVLRS